MNNNYFGGKNGEILFRKTNVEIDKNAIFLHFFRRKSFKNQNFDPQSRCP
jgi:hypothetical protein